MKKFWGLKSLLLPAAFLCMFVSGCDLLGSDDDDDFAERSEDYVRSSSSDDDNNSSSSAKSSSSSSQKTASSSSGNGAVYNRDDNTVTDLRSGRTYKTVKLDGRIWMAENVNSNGTCYDDDKSNCEKYGSLYASCPDGWHVPSEYEWESMFNSIGGIDSAGYYLKSKTGWSGDSNGVDKYGFAVLPAGYRSHHGYGDYYEDNYVGLGTTTKIKTSSHSTGNATICVVFDQRDSASFTSFSKYDLCYTRCVKDFEPDDVPVKFGSMTDERDGKIYRTEEVGEWTIMAQPLRYTGPDPRNPDSLLKPWCNQDSTECLYRFNVALQGDYSTYLVQGLCPSGWHIPSSHERDLMKAALQDKFSSEYEISHYLYPDTGSDDFFLSSISFRGYNGKFDTIPQMFGRFTGSASVNGDVRCVKDKHTQRYGEVIDSRDGSAYRTVSVGSTEWMVDNLRFKVDSSYCAYYKDSSEIAVQGDSCNVFGRFYCDVRDDICPKGWRIPNEADMDNLSKIYPSTSSWNSTQYWSFDVSGFNTNTNYSGTNDAGLNLLPTGYIQLDSVASSVYYGKRVELRLDSAVYEMYSSDWSKTGDTLYVLKDFRYIKNRCYSIRCVRD